MCKFPVKSRRTGNSGVETGKGGTASRTIPCQVSVFVAYFPHPARNGRETARFAAWLLRDRTEIRILPGFGAYLSSGISEGDFRVLWESEVEVAISIDVAEHHSASQVTPNPRRRRRVGRIPAVLRRFACRLDGLRTETPRQSTNLRPISPPISGGHFPVLWGFGVSCSAKAERAPLVVPADGKLGTTQQ